jgi:hypothetical protein
MSLEHTVGRPIKRDLNTLNEAQSGTITCHL